MCRLLGLAIAISAIGGACIGSPPSGKDLRALERSYWLHASLDASANGYWSSDGPTARPPTTEEIRNAAGLLTGYYGANRLYLMYHKEIPIEEFARVLRAWRSSCPAEVEIVPALVLRMYDRDQSEVFSAREMRELIALLKKDLGFREAAVYDVLPNRDQGECLSMLAEAFPAGLVRVGIQPEENPGAPYAAAVQDTWSGLCAGRTNAQWESPGMGAESLRKWVTGRNEQKVPVAWDLVAVAWDYLPTERGEYPGYDDSSRNMPLHRGRNRLAVRLILETASPETLAGLSSDLFILEASSRNPKRDGPSASFYQCLRKGEQYRGYYARPLEEIASIYITLRSGSAP